MSLALVYASLSEPLFWLSTLFVFLIGLVILLAAFLIRRKAGTNSSEYISLTTSSPALPLKASKSPRNAAFLWTSFSVILLVIALFTCWNVLKIEFNTRDVSGGQMERQSNTYITIHWANYYVIYEGTDECPFDDETKTVHIEGEGKGWLQFLNTSVTVCLAISAIMLMLSLYLRSVDLYVFARPLVIVALVFAFFPTASHFFLYPVAARAAFTGSYPNEMLAWLPDANKRFDVPHVASPENGNPLPDFPEDVEHTYFGSFDVYSGSYGLTTLKIGKGVGLYAANFAILSMCVTLLFSALDIKVRKNIEVRQNLAPQMAA
eukprot:TRINITY_DN2647_c0_g1_i2.p1 TRINITY_DN2647_c0_g1~~TRINITY_DN2647_c0_g1_i2.p1  ORF type:complete len:320 (-),score=36.95 TRINITY_DN2647_c0_g1_i2:36-995(-)